MSTPETANGDAPARRPAIVAVDDEPAVLAAVARDLRRGFGERYRIMRADSGAEALELLGQLRTRGDQVALLVADQNMPGMSGTDYLVEARKIVPDAKRVLLTAYADTEAAIAAINEVALDYYLLKPWDPPEEQLYPVVEDLLTTWEAGAALEAGGVRVIGHRFSKESHDLRDFLARNRVPARWLDVERDGEARELLTVADVAAERLPVALLEDGAVLERPTVLELAERLGIAVPAGAGPLRPRDRRRRPRRAGRRGVRRLRGAANRDGRARGARRPGGPVEPDRELPRLPGRAERLRPRPPRHRPGPPARRRAADASRRRCSSRAEGSGGIVDLTGGGTLSANCVLVASGVSYRQLDAPGFQEFTGAGIYYGAAMTEARSCADQHVVIIGGANSAGQAAVYFSGYAGQGDDARARRLAREVDVALPDRADRRRCRTSTCAPARSAPAAEGEDGRLRAAADPAATTAIRRGRRRLLRLHRRRRRARTGSRAWWRATSAASSSPAATCAGTAGRSSATPTCSRRACPACSWRATCARAR